MQSYPYEDIPVACSNGQTIMISMCICNIGMPTLYKSMVNKIVALYIHKYQNIEADKVDDLLKYMCSNYTASTMFMTYYKRFPKIESLTEENKRYSWELAKEIFPDADTEFKKRAAKIMYAFSMAVS